MPSEQFVAISSHILVMGFILPGFGVFKAQDDVLGSDVSSHSMVVSTTVTRYSSECSLLGYVFCPAASFEVSGKSLIDFSVRKISFHSFASLRFTISSKVLLTVSLISEVLVYHAFEF
ncbi:hypothetical protein BTVI_09812 [Pitangus sulphuratus]|nr:hypothetical protein BTVI_09812 [Pitangus sulphuratus]